jgi:hypothetical protein
MQQSPTYLQECQSVCHKSVQLRPVLTKVTSRDATLAYEEKPRADPFSDGFIIQR